MTQATDVTSQYEFTKTIVTSPQSYNPMGPYSQAVLANKTLYLSGLLGLDPKGQLVNGGAAAQMQQALTNLKHILEAGGSSLEAVAKITMLLSDLNDLQVLNEVYVQYFPRNYPARVMYQVGKLPLGAVVEIEAIALSGDSVTTERVPCPIARI